MLFKKLLAGMSAAAIAASIAALPAAADEIKPDDNGVYGTAGIIWMIQDQWDHKKDIDLDPTVEMETTVVDSTYHNVNITGNGQYTVDMSGYCPPPDWTEIGVMAGYLGVLVKIDFDTYTDVSFQIDSATIDGVDYTFPDQGINPETDEPYQPLEEPESSDVAVDGQKMIKIKNSYGNCPPSEPQIDSVAWTTPDTLSITFTVTGLPTDKIADNADEVIEQVYGTGATDYSAEAEEEESEAEEESAPETEEEAAEGDAAETEAAETKAASDSKKDDKKDEEKSSNTGLIVGIVAACVVVVGAIVFFVVKKKK